jgi:hypothetical protein
MLTGGLWLIPWIAVTIEAAIRPWRCEVCGCHKPVIAAPEPKPVRAEAQCERDDQAARKVA